MTTFLFRLTSSPRFFFALIIAAAGWHLWSLPISPLPWFDETFFASITNALVNGRGFQVEVQNLAERGKEVLLYGPVYYLLTGIPVKLFGIDIVSFRIVNLLFCGLTLSVFYKVLRQLKIDRAVAMFMVVLALFDVILIQNAHSGRMEMVALFFALSAFWYYFKTREDSTIAAVVILALGGILAFLTTPRSMVLVFPLFGFAVVQRGMQKRWRDVLLLIAIPVTVYLVWLFYAYGSFDAFLDFYFKKSDSGEVQARRTYTGFLGGHFYVPFYQYPLIFGGLLSAGLLLAKRKCMTATALFLVSILTYYIVVKDTGGYSVWIVLCFYALIAMAIQQVLLDSERPKYKWVTGSLLVVLILVNFGIFTFKAAVILAGYSDRNPAPLNEWVAQRVSPGDRVVGDDRYYYACMRLGADYKYIERPATDDQRAIKHAQIFEPDYLFISTQTPKTIIESYRNYFQFEEEWTYLPPRQNNALQKFLDRLPMNVQSSYSGTLIKVTALPENENLQ